MPIDGVAEFWDGQSATFDEEPDHGLLDPVVRGAWRELLGEVLPAPPAEVADLGCGTGSLSVLLAEDGYRVRGVDVSPKMIAAARHKAEPVTNATFSVGDAADPGIDAKSVDAIVVRHVTWALPDPGRAIRRWTGLLREHGVLVMVEGLWSTGAGMTARSLGDLVRSVIPKYEIRSLSDEHLWGGPIADERYLLVAHI
jgi:SAM-dependent methyltransferase